MIERLMRGSKVLCRAFCDGQMCAHHSHYEHAGQKKQ